MNKANKGSFKSSRKKSIFWHDFKIYLQFILFIFLFLFLFFGRSVYELYFKPSELEIYMEAYEKTYGKKMEIPDYLRETLPKHKQ